MNKKICVLAAVLALAPLSLAHLASADTNLPQPSDMNNFKKSPNNKEPPTKLTGAKPDKFIEEHKVGTIHDPYDGDPKMIAEGKKVFFGAGCNGCHGGGGGGGICPSIKNDVWVYGSDDDTLARLITLGSQELQKKGYTRKGLESVVAPMPPFGQILQSDEELMKVIAWVHSLYDGPKNRINWTTGGQKDDNVTTTK